MIVQAAWGGADRLQGNAARSSSQAGLRRQRRGRGHLGAALCHPVWTSAILTAYDFARALDHHGEPGGACRTVGRMNVTAGAAPGSAMAGVGPDVSARVVPLRNERLRCAAARRMWSAVDGFKAGRRGER